MLLRSGKERVLVISDTQAPFAHPDALEFLRALRDHYRPTKVVAIGDTLDLHTLGKWAHDPDGYGPREEYERGIEWLRKLYKLFPVAQETTSNHNARYMRRAFEAGMPSSFLRAYNEVMHHPKGWTFADDIEIDGVIYEHGTRFGGLHAARQAIQVNGRSTVFGHLHSNGSIVYLANRHEMMFGMCVGCLIEYSQYAFKYAKDAKYKPTLGTGLVLNGVPHFAPMRIDKRGRWTGEVT